MNDPDVLFPWEKDGGDTDASAEAEQPDVDAAADAPDAEPSGIDASVSAQPDRESDEATAGDATSAAEQRAPVSLETADGGDREDGDESVELPSQLESEADVATAAATEEAVAGADETLDAADLEDAPEPSGDTAATTAADDESRFEVLDTEYARQAAERASAALREKPIAQKEYYSISEVCELVGLKPHVLRYWETQFQVLNPSKNRSGNRVYQRKEIRLISLVKHLLYEEKYTVEGAKAKLDGLRRSGELTGAAGVVLDRAMVDQLRADLSELTTLLTPPART